MLALVVQVPKVRTALSYQRWFQLKFERQAEAIAIAEQLAGWRIYVTNVRIEQLSLPQAVVYYRDQWQLEHGFHRFKRGQLPALPIYLANEDRIIGLIVINSDQMPPQLRCLRDAKVHLRFI